MFIFAGVKTNRCKSWKEYQKKMNELKRLIIEGPRLNIDKNNVERTERDIIPKTNDLYFNRPNDT